MKRTLNLVYNSIIKFSILQQNKFPYPSRERCLKKVWLYHLQLNFYTSNQSIMKCSATSGNEVLLVVMFEVLTK